VPKIEKKNPEAKTAWNAIECENANDSGGKSMLPIFQKYVIPGCFSLKKKEKCWLISGKT